ncbi:hypothetical protein ACET3Z_019212 [Daucus carota]
MILKHGLEKLTATSIENIVHGGSGSTHKEPAAGDTINLQAGDVQSKFSTTLAPGDSSSSHQDSEVKVKVGPNRCCSCGKRVGLTGFSCRCGNLYYANHHCPEKHECSFDYRAVGKDAIRKANPVVKKKSLTRSRSQMQWRSPEFSNKEAETMNMCSKCYKDMILKHELEILAATSTENIVHGGSGSTHKEPAVGDAINLQAGDVQSKFSTTLAPDHRYPDKHECSFDYQAAVGKDAIRKANPVVKKKSLTRSRSQMQWPSPEFSNKEGFFCSMSQHSPCEMISMINNGTKISL